MYITAYRTIYEFVINFATDSSNPPFLSVYSQTDNENDFNVPDLVMSRVLRKFESMFPPSYTSSPRSISIILDGPLGKQFH